MCAQGKPYRPVRARSLATQYDLAMSSSPTRANRHAGLHRDDVVDCALKLVQDGGAEALTMRKLAAELGVTATTIYWHVGSRDEVVIALIERLSERLAERPIGGSTPRERVMAAARHVWESALEHPEVMKLAHSVGGTSALEMHLEIAMARELTAAGVVGDRARDALRSILICVGGFLVLAFRPDEAVPTELSSTTLWGQVEDPAVDSGTREALTQPIDLDALFETTIQAVVDSYLADVSTPPA